MRSLYVQVYQAVINYWMGVLDPTEFRLLLVVNERTLRYNKEEEVIPIRHFTDGVRTKDGTLITNPIPVCRTNIIRAYKSLIEKNILIVKKHQTRNSTKNKFAINCKFLLEKALEMSKLKLPKRLKESDKGSVRSTEGGQPQVQRGVSEKYTISTDREEQRIEEELQTGRRPELLEIVNSAYEQYKNRVVKVPTTFNQINVSKAWQAALSANEVAGYATLPLKAYYALRSGYAAYQISISIFDFINWTVANWEDLRTNELRWATTMPLTPDIKFFAYFYKHFVLSYADSVKRKELDARKRVKVDTRLKDTEAELSSTKQEMQTLANKLKEAERNTGHYRRLLQEKSTSGKNTTPLKNHSDLKFEEIDPV